MLDSHPRFGTVRLEFLMSWGSAAGLPVILGTHHDYRSDHGEIATVNIKLP